MKTKNIVTLTFGLLLSLSLNAQCTNGTKSSPIYKEGAELVEKFDEAGLEIVRIEYDLIFSSKETTRNLSSDWEYTIVLSKGSRLIICWVQLALHPWGNRKIQDGCHTLYDRLRHSISLSFDIEQSFWGQNPEQGEYRRRRNDLKDYSYLLRWSILSLFNFK